MVKAIYDNLKANQPKDHFTIGIQDDVSHTSLSYNAEFSTEPDNVVRAMFYGLGADGTVGANKNSIKIIGENTDNYAQGYFVYDSKKSGAVTISHLRFGPQPIRSSYLVSRANFVACHQWIFLERYDMLSALVPGGTFLLNSPFGADEVWDHLPRTVQEQIIAKRAKFYVIDAYQVARDTGMGSRMNTILQVCFFAISAVLPADQAIEAIRKSIRDTYGRKGEEIVQKNMKAVDETLAHLFEVKVPAELTSTIEMPPAVFSLSAGIRAGRAGHDLCGTRRRIAGQRISGRRHFPHRDREMGEAQSGARNSHLGSEDLYPVRKVRHGLSAFGHPHQGLRLERTCRVPRQPSSPPKPATKNGKALKYTIQVAPEDCTGCGICVEVCPVKNKAETRLKAINMVPQPPLRVPERENWDFFLKIPEMDRRNIKVTNIRQQQIQEPLFEFSGACSGCGETPYLKLMSQLFGDRAIIANATGCSSIYGGNLPTTPWTKNAAGRGPAWSNSLFEDNAEFGLGFRLSIDKQTEFAQELVRRVAGTIGEELANAHPHRSAKGRSRHLRAAPAG